jgi:hypothetical protein
MRALKWVFARAFGNKKIAKIAGTYDCFPPRYFLLLTQPFPDWMATLATFAFTL